MIVTYRGTDYNFEVYHRNSGYISIRPITGGRSRRINPNGAHVVLSAEVAQAIEAHRIIRPRAYPWPLDPFKTDPVITTEP